MAFRFIHTADIHLDSPLRSLALRDPDLGERIGTATRATFSRIIDLCIDEKVDALMIAGDLYDGEQTSMKTALFLASELKRLDDANIRTFIIRGNHDAMSKITKELVLPESVTVFGGHADVVELERAVPVAIHGISFRQPTAPESLLPKYKRPVPGAVNIGLMHTSLNGSPGHDVYAPCSVAELMASGFRYWGLGHIHKRMQHDGAATIVMPGIPQGRDINEAGAGSVSLVTVSDDASIRVEERIVASARFDRLAVDLNGEMEWAGAVSRIGRALSDTITSPDGLHRVVRVSLNGGTPLAWRIRRDLELMLAEARNLAERFDSVSIEKIESTVTPLETKAAAGGGALAELARIIDTEVLDSAFFASQAEEAADDLRKALPSELKALLGQDESELFAILQPLARDGVDTVLARLRDGTAGEG